MQLTEILDSASIKVPLEAGEKYQAIEELIKLLCENSHIADQNAVQKAVMDREAVRSTGIGQGFAIPHGKSNAVDRLVMAIGKTKEPIDFGSIDGQPVSLVVLLVSPVDQTGPHIQALAQISRLMTGKEFRQKIWQSNSAKELYQIIDQYERNGSISGNQSDTR